jgi:hypothetical protein
MKKRPARYLVTREDGSQVWMCNLEGYTESELLEAGYDTVDEKEDVAEEKRWVKFFLEASKMGGIDLEVVQYALLAMREDPSLTPSMAMNHGFSECIK